LVAQLLIHEQLVVILELPVLLVQLVQLPLEQQVQLVQLALLLVQLVQLVLVRLLVVAP
jgi:hypothetical protein